MTLIIIIDISCYKYYPYYYYHYQTDQKDPVNDCTRIIVPQIQKGYEIKMFFSIRNIMAAHLLTCPIIPVLIFEHAL